MVLKLHSIYSSFSHAIFGPTHRLTTEHVHQGLISSFIIKSPIELRAATHHELIYRLYSSRLYPLVGLTPFLDYSSIHLIVDILSTSKFKTRYLHDQFSADKSSFDQRVFVIEPYSRLITHKATCTTVFNMTLNSSNANKMAIDCPAAHEMSPNAQTACAKVFSIVELRIMILEQVRITDLYATRQVSAAINTTLKKASTLERGWQLQWTSNAPEHYHGSAGLVLGSNTDSVPLIIGKARRGRPVMR